MAKVEPNMLITKSEEIIGSLISKKKIPETRTIQVGSN
jgi:hypothetical protein